MDDWPINILENNNPTIKHIFFIIVYAIVTNGNYNFNVSIVVRRVLAMLFFSLFWRAITNTIKINFMNAKIFVSAICLFFASAAMSQVSLGIQGGGVMSMARVKEDALSGQSLKGKSKYGWQAGIIADIPFGEGNLRLMPELNYVNKGYKLNTSINVVGQTVTVDGTSNVGYIELPLNLAYTIPVGDNFFVIGAGPYASYGVNGKNKVKSSINGQGSEETSKVEFGSDESQIKPFDYGVNVMAGYLFGNGMQIKLNYSYGLAELSNAEFTTYKNSYLGLSLGYYIKRAGK